MKRKIYADEVRRFFEAAIRQFDEAGFYLHSVRIHRKSDDGKCSEITLNYSEDDTITHKNEQNPK